MILLSSQYSKQFQEKILSWYKKNKRDLPWRDVPVGTPLQQKAYYILISEVMSQQTQISRVVPKYQAWLATFPTLIALAKAEPAEVLRLWSGLGYNRRALYLQKAAQKIISEHHGLFPQDEKTLKTLPGIGEYTARAILCFAFHKQIAVVDTNVKRVILTKIQKSKFKNQNLPKKEIQKIADILLPHGRAAEWNQALMDYAAAKLKKEKIPLPKQSRFIGSNRFYRGKIIKLLIEKKKVAIQNIGTLLKKDFQETEKLWLENIIEGLIHDGLIKKENNMLSL